MKLKLTLSYDGRNFCGWQAQNNGRSVQRTLTDACMALYGRRCLVTGCSRTDSGVHAREYVCTAVFEENGDIGETSDICTVIAPENVVRALNVRLPADVAVINAEPAADDFHPRYDVKSKTYEYVLHDSGVKSPFLVGLVTETFPISDDALALMNDAARAMSGRRDFAAFMASGSKIKDTVRTVFDCGVRREGEFVIFRVTADGFLYKMVRTMAGTSLAVGRGRLDVSDVEGIIGSRDRRRAAETLPPDGLYLCRVDY